MSEESQALPVPSEEDEANPASCPVVGIGASAGGLEAISQFLKALPPTTGLAFVIVQHLDPRHESILAEILARCTAMEVKQADQGTAVQPNCVYVIPPNVRMAIRNGVLDLTPREVEHAKHLPIDFFFASLAQDQKSRAFGIVLSGTASDGTVGIKAIKSEGGITFAQDETARFDSMPRNAIAGSVIDFILPPEGIARELARIADHGYLGSNQNGGPIEEGPTLQKIFALLREHMGVDFSLYKRPTIKRRLSRRMTLHQLNDPEAYLAVLEQDSKELELLFGDLLINVTEFFRDPAAFELLTQKVFPSLLQDRKSDEPIRIWVPGCSTGEEVYSIAICLTEYLEGTGRQFSIQIFGTDVSERAIEVARTGRFSNSITSYVSPERLRKFFVALEAGGFQVARSLRQCCVFSRQDLVKDPPLSRMDLISCRNVLIYLSSILQRRVLALFSYSLQPRGVLLLGSSESVGSLQESFIELDREHKIYSRNLQLERPGLEAFTPSPPWSGGPALGKPQEDIAGELERDVDRVLIRDYGPSGLLINGDYQVLKFIGEMAPYLTEPSGYASLNVSKMVREDLVLPLRSALQDAAAKDAPARRNRVQISREERFEEVNIVVRPIFTSKGRYFMILFEDRSVQEQRRPATKSAASTQFPADTDLAEELATTRTYLQSLIEELRTANEETQSTNEELQSTNEELQTAKEELQSSNEELTTTNDEMKSRNVELSEVNNDLLNLLSSLRIPIVMLSRDLRIRRFTPMSEKALSIIPSDVGRPISHLKPRINDPDLETSLMQVIESTQAVEKDVRDQDGHWYSMRINPYRTGDNQADGAVIQLLDIDQLKRTLEASENARRYSEAILGTIREPLVVLDERLNIQTANRSFFETFEISENEVLNQNLFEVGDSIWDVPRLREMLEEIRSGADQDLQDVEIEQKFPRVGWRSFQYNARALRRDDGAGLILLAMEDVTHRKMAAEAKYRRLFEAAKDGILIIDAETGEITDANAFVLDLFRLKREELLGRPYWKVPPLKSIPDAESALARLQGSEVIRFPDVTGPSKDGSNLDLEVVGNMYMEGERRVVQFNIRDVTERKQFDRHLQQSAKLESLGLLAGGIAHDFNNLLTGIIGNASLVLDNVKPDSPDRESLREILKAGQRAADLTSQMLAYSGRGRFVVKLTDFSELVRGITFLVRSSIPKSVDLDLRLADGLPLISADATQIHQLVMNLVINAAEAIGESARGLVRVTTGTVELDAEIIKAEYPADDITPGSYVFLEVTDSGSGMDDATKTKIFDPFFTTKFTGRGLGLAAVLGIVRGHQGAIRVDSTLGQGTTFRVMLPASPERNVPTPPSKRRFDMRGTGLVLVVDDEEVVLRLARPSLLRYGYQVVTAMNGEEAIDVVRKRAAELKLIILDLTMPVMGGEEAALKIKAVAPHVPIILSSGYDETPTLQRMGDRLLAGFIRKPYTVQTLLEVVKAALTEKNDGGEKND